MSETMDPSEQITLHSAAGPEEDTPYSQMRSHRSYSSNLSDMSMQTSESDGAICTTPGAEGGRSPRGQTVVYYPQSIAIYCGIVPFLPNSFRAE